MPTLAKRKTKPARSKVNRTHKPDDMSLEQWQIELRRDFGRRQSFVWRNLGEDPVFTEFAVTNPEMKSSYRVRIRGPLPGDNRCTCGDFATNLLGTCKHIEFILGKLESKPRLRNRLSQGDPSPGSELVLVNGSRRFVRMRLGSETPMAFTRLVDRWFDGDRALRPEGFATFDEFLTLARKIDHDLSCDDDVLQFIAQTRDTETVTRRVTESFPRGPKSPGLKNLVKVPLYDYQAEGALFAAKAGRCLIGDEMGLGKTIQALAATEIMARLHGVERVLIVCPTSLKHQWHAEIGRFTDRDAVVIGGSIMARRQGFNTPSFFKIMNYDTVHLDLPEIEKWNPDLVILDEAQRIKNWATRVARSVKKIQSPYCIVLTGTPLENRLEELISIVQFVDRFRMGPTYKLLHNHQVHDEGGRVVGYQKLDEIGRTLEPILLRRRKEAVLTQLPTRIDQNIFVPMTPQQREMHEENREIVAKIVQKWRRYKFLSEADKQRLMIALQRMRMSCDSTYLLDRAADFGTKADEFATLIDEMFETPGSKVVVFSQWLGMHEVVKRRLEKRKIDHVLFHGGVPGAKRKDLVERFRNEDDCRLFMSTDAGGVGLNLQFASNVVNLDLPWNPAVLEQRIGRVHRLGQQRPVQVVNFVAQGTIEHGMLSVLKFKKSLFAGILDGGERDISLGGSRLTKFMESVENATGSIPAGDDAQSEEPQVRANGQPPAQPVAQAANPFAQLLQMGMAMLNSAATPPGGARAAAPSRISVERDAQGESFVKLPMPSPEVLQTLVGALGQWLESMRK